MSQRNTCILSYVTFHSHPFAFYFYFSIFSFRFVSLFFFAVCEVMNVCFYPFILFHFILFYFAVLLLVRINLYPFYFSMLKRIKNLKFKILI